MHPLNLIGLPVRSDLFSEFPQLCLVAKPMILNMSARSSSQGVQTTLETKMVTVHKDLLGAPEGKTNVIFVDDVNLPARDAFDSQPPVELLRQLVSPFSLL